MIIANVKEQEYSIIDRIKAVESQRSGSEHSMNNSKQISIDSSSQLTDPQMIAKVRDFFKGR
jgi:hypothetical protein